MRMLAALLVTTGWCAAASGHRALLPQPREVRYAAGSLPLRGMSVGFASVPDEDDRFAAVQLAAGLTAAAQAAVEVRDQGPAKGAVVLHRAGNLPPLPGADDWAGPDGREAYVITVTPAGAEIRSASSAGLFYGVQTLLQMVEDSEAGATLPAVVIHDWPVLPYRGFMMDLSHGQHLRLEEIERQIELLARFKGNQFYLYSEGSIELEGYSLVSPGGRYTQQELARIVAYARRRHVDVVPCLELYGHLHDLFRVERFSSLALPRYGREFDPRNPRVLEVLDDLVDQTTRLFPGPWYHIGFDEPWSLGKIGVEPGSDPFQRYVDVLGHVAGRARARGKRVLFWADVVYQHPELIAKLPAGAIAVPWDYDDRADFADQLGPLARARIPMVAASGIWNWDDIFPHYRRAAKNMNAWMASGQKHGISGLLNTAWADSAQAIVRLALPGIAMGAAAAWQSPPLEADAFFTDYAAQQYPSAIAPDAAVAVRELSRAEEIFRNALEAPTIHALWADPLEPRRLERIQAHAADLRQARLLANSAEERVRRAMPVEPASDTLPALLLSARLFDYLAMKYLYAVEWAGYFRELRENPSPALIHVYLDIQLSTQNHSMLADLMDTIAELRESYRQAWLEESTAYRLGAAMARWEVEGEYWRAMQARVREMLRARKPGDPIPTLEELRPRRGPGNG